MEVLLTIALVIIVVGPFMGIIAFFKVRNTHERIQQLQLEVEELWRQLNKQEAATNRSPASPVQEAPVTEKSLQDYEDDSAHEVANTRDFADQEIEPAPAINSPLEAAFVEPEGLQNSGTIPFGQVAPPPPPSSAPPLPPGVPSAGARKPDRSLEMMLGTKWLNWVGALFLIMFVGYGLKYSYDNAWIGPQGRLAIGTLFGMTAIGLGEHFRRKNWAVLFQTVTGIGIATFYACVFFSFKVYNLSSPGTSFALAIGVTALAVFLAVFHNAISIAVLAVIGGFLSPVLISTGQNSPYVLFSYILVLDLVAMAAAYFRRWHALDLLCFAGTVLMLIGWYMQFGHLDGQLQPALIFTSLFYLVFLLIPTLHAMARREEGSRQGTVLIVGNALFSATMYYRLLYPEHSHALGFVVLGQAVAMFALFRTWVGRTGGSNMTAQSLLVLALCLTVAAVPLHLSRFGLAIVWALQGALLTLIGLRYANLWTRGIGLAVVALAAGSLFYNLPLHREMFVPVLNMAFAAWLLVAAAALLVAWLTMRSAPDDIYRQNISMAAFVIGAGLLWLLPAFENEAFWRLNYIGQHGSSHSMSTLVVIWSAMSVGMLWAIHRRHNLKDAMHLVAGLGFVVTGLVYLSSFGVYQADSQVLFFNTAFLPRLVFVAALLWAARSYAANGREMIERAFETAAHIALVTLAAAELKRWGMDSQQVSDRIAFSMISLIWGLHAFVLLWWGLRTRRRFRRTLGFALFGLVVLKVLLVDTSELEKVYRILSFGGTGLLLLGAGYFFQKYSATLSGETESQEESAND